MRLSPARPGFKSRRGNTFCFFFKRFQVRNLVVLCEHHSVMAGLANSAHALRLGFSVESRISRCPFPDTSISVLLSAPASYGRYPGFRHSCSLTFCCFHFRTGISPPLYTAVSDCCPPISVGLREVLPATHWFVDIPGLEPVTFFGLLVRPQFFAITLTCCWSQTQKLDQHTSC